jgi:hypothetical protein
MVASLALETALDTAIQGRQQQATAATGVNNGPDGGEQGGSTVVRNLAQELELIFKRDTGTVPGTYQCCGSMTFWCGSGSGSADPFL